MAIRSGTRVFYRDSFEEVLGPKSAYASRTTHEYRSPGSFYRSGTNNPSWRRQVAAGVSATTAFTATDAGVIVEPGYIRTLEWDAISKATIENLVSGCYVPWPGTPVDNGPLTSSIDNEARAKFYSAVRQASTLIQGGVVAGEWGKTKAQINGMVPRLASTLYAYKNAAKRFLKGQVSAQRNLRSARAKKRAANEARVGLSQLYLEYTFGLMPILYDVKAGAQALTQIINDLPRQKRIFARAKGEYRSVSGGYSYSAPVTAARCFYRFNVHEQSDVSVQYVAGMSWEETPADSHISQLATTLGLNFGSFVPTLYELLPYSWLVDYFTNLGQVIEAEFTSLSQVLWICKTVRREHRKTYRGEPNQAAFESVVTKANRISFGGTRCLITTWARAVTRTDATSNMSPPTFQLTLPGSPWKWANTIALVLSRV